MQNKAEAWRVIAYIPREKNFYSKAQYNLLPDKSKTKRLQQLYQAALQDLIKTQSDGSMNNIELRLGNKSKVVNLKIPLMFIIGDIQGGDAICGKNLHHGKTARRISRICDAGPQHLGNPKIGNCSRLHMQDIMDLVIENDIEALHALYQAPHWIAWFDIDYSGNPEGIFSAACPLEPLHALEKGIFKYILV